MKRVLIGVSLVVLVVTAGYIGLVVGRYSMVPVMTPTITAISPATATTSMLVMPSMHPIISATVTVTPPTYINPTVNPTTQFVLSSAKSAVAIPPTPKPDCHVVNIDMSDGKSTTVSVDQPSSLWFTATNERFVMVSPVIEGEIEITGEKVKDYGIPNYSFLDLFRHDAANAKYEIPAGIYTLSLRNWMSASEDPLRLKGIKAIYIIYICPPIQ
jgi:hypothetical protein